MPPLYGLADPHLGRSIGHVMAKYGAPWHGHPQTLFRAWDATVPADAIVLVPGDLSVATAHQDILADYADLEARTGALKLLSPGNHDRDWDTQSKAEKMLAALPSLSAVKGQARRLAVADDAPGLVYTAICGALTPGCEYYGTHPDHEKQYSRGLHRLELALTRAQALMRPGDSLVVGLHYLPFFAYNQASPFSDLIEAAGASLCVYGHLHTPAEWQLAFQGLRDGTVYRLLAADYLQMTPLLLGHLGADGLTLALALS